MDVFLLRLNKNSWASSLVVILLGLGFSASGADFPEAQLRGGLPNFFAKIASGEPVKVAYLGGSITAAEGWRVMTTAWLKESYPGGSITEVNAAHSGTTSDLACFRLERDCLYADPDLLFIEFAVNDGGASKERIIRGVEGVIRQARAQNPKLDICLVYTLSEAWVKLFKTGMAPHTFLTMDQVAAYYDLPSVHMGKAVLRGLESGQIIFKGEALSEEATGAGRILFSHDGVHPLNAGHRIYAEALGNAIKAMAGLGTAGAYALPTPMREDNLSAVAPTSLKQVKLSPGWRQLDPDLDPIADRFKAKLPELWCAEAAGESITVRFRGDSILIYDLVGPDCGQVRMTLDGKDLGRKARFDAWTTDHRVYYFIAAKDLGAGEHQMRFEIDAEEPDKAAILKQRGVTMDDPARYRGTAWYVGEVLVTGEVLPVD